MAFIGVILGCVLLYFLIKTIGFKKYLIWSWNVAISILSFIPGMGWIERFCTAGNGNQSTDGCHFTAILREILDYWNEE